MTWREGPSAGRPRGDRGRAPVRLSPAASGKAYGARCRPEKRHLPAAHNMNPRGVPHRVYLAAARRLQSRRWTHRELGPRESRGHATGTKAARRRPGPRAEETLAERALEAGDVSAMQHTDAHQRGGASGTAAAAAADGAASAATSSTAKVAIAGAFELAAPATVLTYTRPKAPQPATSGPFTTPAQAAATSTAWSSRVVQDTQQTHAAHRSTASGGVGGSNNARVLFSSVPRTQHPRQRSLRLGRRQQRTAASRDS